MGSLLRLQSLIIPGLAFLALALTACSAPAAPPLIRRNLPTLRCRRRPRCHRPRHTQRQRRTRLILCFPRGHPLQPQLPTRRFRRTQHIPLTPLPRRAPLILRRRRRTQRQPRAPHPLLTLVLAWSAFWILAPFRSVWITSSHHTQNAAGVGTGHFHYAGSGGFSGSPCGECLWGGNGWMPTLDQVHGKLWQARSPRFNRPSTLRRCAGINCSDCDRLAWTAPTASRNQGADGDRVATSAPWLVPKWTGRV